MKKAFIGLTRFLAVVCAALFILTTVLALFLFNTKSKLLNARLYKDILSELNVYEHLPTLIGRLLVSSQAASPESGMPGYMQNFSDDDWAAIMTIILPPDEMKAMVESVIEGTFAYLRGEVDQVTISMTSLKARLAGPAGEELLMEFLKNQPPCTPEELTVLSGIAYSEEMVICSPPEETLPIIVPLLHAELQSALAGVPDEVVVIEPHIPNPSTGNRPFSGNPVATFRAVRIMLGLSPLLPLFFLAGVTLLRVRSLQGWMRWWGIPFLAAGVAGIGAGLASTPLTSLLWNKSLVPRIPSVMPAAVISLGEEILGAVAHGLSEPIVLQSLILIVLGLGAWIGSYFIRPGAAPQEANRPL
jgi:predicted PurR-regulated permease PerM